MEMGTELTNLELGLQLSTVTTTDLQKAWHIFGLLLSLGRPARPIELASKCTLFYTTPNLVEFLCGIPNSPIYLTLNHLVTFSSTGYLAVMQFVKNSNVTLNLLPRFGFEFEFGFGVLRQKRIHEEEVKTYFRKRRKMRSDDKYLPVAKKRGIFYDFEEEDESAHLRALPRWTGNAGKVYLPDGNMNRGIKLQSCDSQNLAVDIWQQEKAIIRTSLFSNSSYGHFSSGLGNPESGNGKATATLVNGSEVGYLHASQHPFNCVNDGKYQELSMAGKKISNAIQSREISDVNIMQNPAVSTAAKIDDNSATRNTNFFATSFMEVDQQMNAHRTEAHTVIHAYETTFEDLKTTERIEEESSINSCCSRRYIGNQLIDVAETDKLLKVNPLENAAEAHNKVVSSIEKEKGRTPLKSEPTLTANAVSLGRSQQAKSSPKSKSEQKNAQSHRLESIGKPLENGNTAHLPVKEQLSKRDKKSILSKQNLLFNKDRVMNAKEKREGCNKNGESASIAAFEQLDLRGLPDFEAFVAEEQEGSGGYGTVYKARRKSDGVKFAIKCPHANANRNHVQNELKMLERFGGKNFVIKYEGAFKSGNSDCLVLEHVEHDRPEVLKRDMSVSELQWYGYCMFRALAGLHKQGVVHRDVKPGNFLFNRKACKGYLIDFNLAMDLNQKHGATVGKTKVGHDVNFNHVPLPHGKSLASGKNSKFVTTKSLEVAHQDRGKFSKSLLLSKNMKKETEQPKTHNKVGSRNITKNQCADGSGITSAKDATSTRTPSGEKFREPLPSYGRKELISLVHEALQGTNNKAVSVPISKRKRIAAPPRQTDCKFVYLTPMPLHSAGVAVSGAGLLKAKGDGKHNREGPCVGTKGFRAPEVLVRSQHQGLKVDIWSAGVTLLYLMIGRTPFVGDPEQNIKEIAKLRDSEDLWEVAKLHNRESSFPADLLDIKSLPSLKLQDWCKQNTRRPEFFDSIPRSLFDLVDKCLTVNPRLRISAEEALRHEFFATCHEALRKHRLLRQGVSVDSRSNLILHGESQICEEVS